MTYLILPENEHQVEEWKAKWEPISDEVIIWKLHNWAGRYVTESPKKDKYINAKTCGRPFNGGLCVWVNGDVTVCCVSEDKRMVIGNMYEQTFEEIMFGAKRRRILGIHQGNNFFQCGLPCEKCDQIFDRSDALVYTNKGRKTGTAILLEDYAYNFNGN